jgi:hypothetical protein
MAARGLIAGPDRPDFELAALLGAVPLAVERAADEDLQVLYPIWRFSGVRRARASGHPTAASSALLHFLDFDSLRKWPCNILQLAFMIYHCANLSLS